MKIQFFFLTASVLEAVKATRPYPVPGTSQSSCTDYQNPIGARPSVSQVDCAGTGQDASNQGLAQEYCSHGDDTVTDMNTGLMWTKEVWPKTYAEAEASLPFEFAGYNDWRLPTIKELYTLINFDGVTGVTEDDNVPYIDTNHFDAHLGTVINQRFIDGQVWSTNSYTGAIMDSGKTNKCQFGVNFIDGRIKCYGSEVKWTRYVRGAENVVGVNDFAKVPDKDIIEDKATGLQWMMRDSGHYNQAPGSDGSMDWNEAIDFCKNMDFGNGYADWRLPTAHELQSIVDYSRSPDATSSAAIDPIFESSKVDSEVSSEDWGWYWTSTTHYDGQPEGSAAVYVAFGRATGYYNNKADTTLRPMVNI